MVREEISVTVPAGTFAQIYRSTVIARYQQRELPSGRQMLAKRLPALRGVS